MPLKISTKKNNDLSKVDVLILSGGKGTRLKKVISDRPKPMARVANRPFLDILIDYVSGYGFRRFVLCTGYRSDFIKKYYKNNLKDIEIILSEEDQPLGTAGAIKNAGKIISSDPFVVMNGDSFCPVNLSDFYNFHLKKKSKLSIVVTKKQDSSDYGVISFNSSQKVVSFSEKKVAGSNFISAGIYLVSKEILKAIPAGINYALEHDLFPKCVGNDFYSYNTSSDVLDIGTPERLKVAKKVLHDRAKNKK